MSATTEQLVAAVRAFAEENYTRGGDVIVEAFTDDEIIEDLLKGGVSKDIVTEKQAVAAAREYIGLHEEQAANVLSQSGEHDDEAAQHMRNSRDIATSPTQVLGSSRETIAGNERAAADLERKLRRDI